jgi:hypothetical protein
MRLQIAALAASLAVTAGGGSAPVLSASAQDTPGDGIRAFLFRLERVVRQADVAAYDALLTESADRGRAAAFVDAELMPGVTRVVIQERDRGPLAGTVPGNGYSLVVDAFEEFGDRARISTWWLDLMRDRDAPSGTEWLIADQKRLSSVESLYRLSLNPAAQFTARNLEIRDEDLKLSLADGSVFVSDTDQGTTALVFIGRGDMRFHPGPETEQSQVRIFSGGNGIETRFDAAYLRINPGDFERLISSQRLVSRPVDQNDFRAADRIFREESPKSFGLELGDLTRDPWSVLPRPGDLVAEIRTRRFNTLTYSRASASREDISLFDRNSHKTIAVYSSPLNDRQDVSLGVEDETGDFDVWHYDIDVSSTPDRRWIEGLARLSIRVGAIPISSLTLRLADPLVVQSVVSAEYGRLFAMRVKNQNSLVISLPTTLPQGAALTLAVTYAGRLDPQTLDAETAAVGQLASQQDPGDSLKRPEPSFVYSNQSNWYPRPSRNHYATARLRITVPVSFACVASGERDTESPALVTAKDSSRRKVYVFNAAQPLRYLAFVVSRLATVQTIATDLLKVSVEANPGHVRRGREVADRAVEIAQFYQSILGDYPYPTFTVALVESDLPGGHSPGYFAVLHEPLSQSPAYLPRNDPASFENYPDFFLAHELAHQWWGQAVGWRNYHEQWLSEGFAQYFAALYAQQRGAGVRNPGSPGDNGVFRGVMRQMRKWAVDQTDQGPISLGYRLGHIQGNSRIMRALVYDKSAIVLHMLRRLVGDEVFFRGLQRFYRASRFRSAGTVDFQVAMEAEAGRTLDRFFDRWIYGSTLPRLNFSYRVDGRSVVLHIDQVGELFDVPVTVTLQYADRTSADILVPVTERSVDLRVPLARPLRGADISKDDVSLASFVKN